MEDKELIESINKELKLLRGICSVGFVLISTIFFEIFF